MGIATSLKIGKSGLINKIQKVKIYGQELTIKFLMRYFWLIILPCCVFLFGIKINIVWHEVVIIPISLLIIYGMEYLNFIKKQEYTKINGYKIIYSIIPRVLTILLAMRLIVGSTDGTHSQTAAFALIIAKFFIELCSYKITQIKEKPTQNSTIRCLWQFLGILALLGGIAITITIISIQNKSLNASCNGEERCTYYQGDYR